MKKMFLFFIIIFSHPASAQFGMRTGPSVYVGWHSGALYTFAFSGTDNCSITLTYTTSRRVIHDKYTRSGDSILLKQGFTNSNNELSKLLLVYDFSYQQIPRAPGYILKNNAGRRIIDAATCYDYAAKENDSLSLSRMNVLTTFIINGRKEQKYAPVSPDEKKPFISFEYCIGNLELPGVLKLCVDKLKAVPSANDVKEQNGMLFSGVGYYHFYDSQGRLIRFGYSPVQICNTCLDGFDVNINYNHKTGLAETITSYGGALITTISYDERGSITKILTMNYDEVREELEVK